MRTKSGIKIKWNKTMRKLNKSINQSRRWRPNLVKKLNEIKRWGMILKKKKKTKVKKKIAFKRMKTRYDRWNN